DPEPVAVELPWIHAGDGAVRRVAVLLQLRFDVETKEVAVADRRMLLPTQLPPARPTIGLRIQRLVGRRLLVFGELVPVSFLLRPCLFLGLLLWVPGLASA